MLIYLLIILLVKSDLISSLLELSPIASLIILGHFTNSLLKFSSNDLTGGKTKNILYSLILSLSNDNPLANWCIWINLSTTSILVHVFPLPKPCHAIKPLYGP